MHVEWFNANTLERAALSLFSGAALDGSPARKSKGEDAEDQHAETDPAGSPHVKQPAMSMFKASRMPRRIACGEIAGQPGNRDGGKVPGWSRI